MVILIYLIQHTRVSWYMSALEKVQLILDMKEFAWYMTHMPITCMSKKITTLCTILAYFS